MEVLVAESHAFIQMTRMSLRTTLDFLLHDWLKVGARLVRLVETRGPTCAQVPQEAS